eukprot:scaffold149_cov315-Pinguiococcus_pyrenoidosus.AAC.22
MKDRLQMCLKYDGRDVEEEAPSLENTKKVPQPFNSFCASASKSLIAPSDRDGSCVRCGGLDAPVQASGIEYTSRLCRSRPNGGWICRRCARLGCPTAALSRM